MNRRALRVFFDALHEQAKERAFKRLEAAGLAEGYKNFVWLESTPDSRVHAAFEKMTEQELRAIAEEIANGSTDGAASP